MQEWQQGYDMAMLRSITQKIQKHEEGRAAGAFQTKENHVAGWLAEGALHESPTKDSLVVGKISKTQRAIKDFTGATIAIAPKGTLVISKASGSASEISTLISNLAWNSTTILWKHWADHPEEMRAAWILNFTKIGTAISASAEIRALHTRGIERTNPESETDKIGICKLNPNLNLPSDAANLSQWEPIVKDLWENHYSSYNKRRSWHAVALRSFGGDPAFIEKPSEMSAGWKKKNPAALELPIANTDLMYALPGAIEILSRLPVLFERVRLMRLDAGGELSRHADITDRDAGTADGKIFRLHLPITTNSDCTFTSWDTNNKPQESQMQTERWYYLDVRKPHSAKNKGTSDRIHLVADVSASPILRSLLS